MPYDILASQARYNIRSFICRRHISSTEGGYHIEDISPVPQGTDIIVKNLFYLPDKRDFLHGALDWNRTSGLQSRSLTLYPTELRTQIKCTTQKRIVHYKLYINIDFCTLFSKSFFCFFLLNRFEYNTY